MLIVLPVWKTDAHLALKNLAVCRKIDAPLLEDGKKIPYDCLVTTSEDYDPTEVVTAAHLYFRSVELHRYATYHLDPRTWPGPQNWAWQESARYVEQHYSSKDVSKWLWWEQDAVPIRLGWLSSLDNGHRNGGQPFAGNIVEGQYTYMAGVGIYPVNISNYCNDSMRVRKAPFDVVAGVHDGVPRRCTRLNHILQHNVRLDNTGDHFATRADFDKLVLSTAVLYHRCDDGSLQDLMLADTIPAKIERPRAHSRIVTKAIENRHAVEIVDPVYAFIQLGSVAEILRTLPIAHAIWQRDGRKPFMRVADEHAGILEGISYVRPFEGDPPEGAIVIAAQSDVITESTSADIYEKAGYRALEGRLPLLFDRRDKARENALCKEALGVGTKDKRPVLLMDIDTACAEDITFRWGHKFRLVDLLDLKPQRHYDLLGLLEQEAVLLSGSPEFLTLAVKCSIVKPEGVVLREVMHRHIFNFARSVIGGPCLVHVFPDHWPQGNHPEERRLRVARQSFLEAYASHPAWHACPVADEQLPRLMDDETRSLPYVKDILDFATAFYSDDDVLVFTCTDTGISPKLAETILLDVTAAGGAYALRREFKRIDQPLGTQAALRRGAITSTQAGLFAFPVKWWKEHRTAMPDLLMGAEGWDACLQVLCDQSEFKVWREHVYHEKHDTRWAKADNRYSLPSQIHNIRRAVRFMQQHKIDPSRYGLKAI